MDTEYYYGVVFMIVLVLITLIAVSSRKLIDDNEKAGANFDKYLDILKERKFKSSKNFFIGTPQNAFRQVSFDINRKEISIIDAYADTHKLINFNQIIECEIIEDNTTIMKGGVGRAIVGGVLAGGVGAIVGAGTRSTFGNS